MATPEKSSDGLQVTRVPNSWNPPRRTRDVDIKLEPCKIRNCTTCQANKEAGVEDDGHHHGEESSHLESSTSSKGVVYSVLWAKSSQKKNKIWENDGFLTIIGNDLTLKDLSGNIVDSTKNHKLPDNIDSGTVIKFGGREVQLQEIYENPTLEQKKDDNGTGGYVLDVKTSSSQVVDDQKTSSRPRKRRDFDYDPRDVVYKVVGAIEPRRADKIQYHDGYLIVHGSDLTLQDLEGNHLGSLKNYRDPEDLDSAPPVKIGGREVQIVGVSDLIFSEDESNDSLKNSGDDDEPSSKKRKVEPKEVVYSILWAKASQKKHKIWEHDGFLTINGNDLTLKDLSGNIVDSTRNHKLPDDLNNGSVIKFGGREIQLQETCKIPTYEQEADMDNSQVDEYESSQSHTKIDSGPKEVIYSILWAKASQKKNKIWEHDGFLTINGNDLTLKDTENKVLDTEKNYKLPEDLENGTVLKIGFREVQIQDVCSISEGQKDANGPCILERMGHDDEGNECKLQEESE